MRITRLAAVIVAVLGFGLVATAPASALPGTCKAYTPLTICVQAPAGNSVIVTLYDTGTLNLHGKLGVDTFLNTEDPAWCDTNVSLTPGESETCNTSPEQKNVNYNADFERADGNSYFSPEVGGK